MHQNKLKVLEVLKEMGLTVAQARIKWAERRKEKADAQRARIDGLVKAKADQAKADLVHAQNESKPKSNAPFIIATGGAIVIAFMYFLFGRKRKSKRS